MASHDLLLRQALISVLDVANQPVNVHLAACELTVVRRSDHQSLPYRQKFRPVTLRILPRQVVYHSAMAMVGEEYMKSVDEVLSLQVTPRHLGATFLAVRCDDLRLWDVVTVPIPRVEFCRHVKETSDCNFGTDCTALVGGTKVYDDASSPSSSP
jgi:hypothetical protein